MIVLLLAVWKLGGIVAPLDCHAPSDLMEAMLRNVAPTYVVIPSSDTLNQRIAHSLLVPIEVLEPDACTITALSQQFLDFSPHVPPKFYLPPQPDDVCLYIHTSSASSVSNLKCVPISHHSLVTNGRSQQLSLQKSLPNMSFEHLRVLGWSPFSHIMSMGIDLYVGMLLTRGCYIFALVPSTYPVVSRPDTIRQFDVPTLIFEAILEHEPHVLVGVPWILDGLRNAWNAETDVEQRARISAALRNFRYFITAGAATNEESLQWAKEHGLPVLNTMGMTELGGVLFHSLVSEAATGWSIDACCISDAVLELIDENGDIIDSEGELQITSRLISKGYLKFESSAFSQDKDGWITFRTGDIYARSSDSGRLTWKGRRDDFIQLVSGESLDPRVVEKALNSCPLVEQSSVVGNMFLSATANFACAIIELTPEGVEKLPAAKAQITKVLAAVNRGLAPPLRIAWSRVLILDETQHIPYTRKHTVFRKKLQALFGDQLSRFLSAPTKETVRSSFSSTPTPKLVATVLPNLETESIIFDTVCHALKISSETLAESRQSMFSELGMDSTMAIIIVNTLNQRLSLSLPPNTCHNYIDLASLTSHIFENLKSDIPLISPIPKAIHKTPHAPDPEPIVIIGQALRLPGDINSPESLWKALVDKRQDILTRTPPDRWNHESFKQGPSGRITFDKSGFINITSFDNAFFGIPTPEALFVSPTTRLTLESAFEALESANIPISKVKGTDMGVFVAAGLDSGYSELLFLDKGYDAFSRYYGTGIATSTACGRLSYLLDIHGPSMTVETACSGGLVALDQAVRHLESGRGESAIVCGANTHTGPGMFGFLSAQKMTSTNSRCATFTNEADGYAASEGVVSVIIKTQSAAIRDGDKILGVIKATDTMHNGRTQGLVAPSTKAQVSLQRALLERASWKPDDIDFVEAHGTGTPLGDLIEIQGINEVFRASHTLSRPLIVGAAKSCVGHTETSSGLVGLVKALTSFSKEAVPGLTHLNEANMNPSIDCSVIPMHIPCHPVQLKRRSAEPFRALVVAYGFAGTLSGVAVEAPSNSVDHHMVLAEVSSPLLFVISAKTQLALLAYIRLYLDFCSDAPTSAFRSICYTSCVGREHYRHRFACVARDMQQLISSLKERLFSGVQASSNLSNPCVAFGYPGQGSQFSGMAKDLAVQYSGFRSILSEYANLAGSLSGYPVLRLLLGTSDCNDDINQSQIAQICIFVYQCSVSKWLEWLEVRPQGVVGHSLGEIAAAVSAGALSFTDGLHFVIARASALKANPACPGAMAAVAAPEAIISNYISSLNVTDRVTIAVFNGMESHVISGAAAAIDLVHEAVRQDGIRCTKLKVDQGFHSYCIEDSLPTLQKWLSDNESIFKPLRVPFFSTLLADKVLSGQYLRTGYWVEHAKRPVKFHQTALELGSETSLNVILDIGPQPTMWSSLQSLNLPDKLLLATTAKQGKDQESALLQAMAALFELGLPLNLERIYEDRGETFHKTTIPTYPFQRQHHYPAYIPSLHALPAHMSQKKPSDTTLELFPVNQPLLELLRDHRIEGRQVLPGAAFADYLARLSYNAPKYVECVRFHQPLVLETLGTLVEVTLASDHSFQVSQRGSSAESAKVCSGSLPPPTTIYSRKPVAASDVPSHTILDRDQIYKPFEGNIHFGPAFRNVSQLNVYSDHVDALITVPASQHPHLDRIRKLDPCLHMFGGLVHFHGISQSMLDEGFYLPTSVEGFTLHTDTLPDEFICRYFLPMTIMNDGRYISLAFEVLSLSGELLVSCQKYSVAWIPKGVAIQAPSPSSHDKHWLFNTWKHEEIPSDPAHYLKSKPSTQPETVTYFGATLNRDLLAPFIPTSSEVIFIELRESERRYLHLSPENLKHPSIPTNYKDLQDELLGKCLSVILDVTSYSSPGSASFTALWQHILWLMKLTMSGKIRVSSFVVVSCSSSPTGITTPPGISAVVQGVLRVYRREAGLTRDVVWGLDLPADLGGAEISRIIESELAFRNGGGSSSSSVVAYRKEPGSDSVVRLVPILRPAPSVTPVSPSLSGVAVIVGMGSIGCALAPYLANAGCSAVVFIGRRPISDSAVVEGLARLKNSKNSPLEAFDYIQADASDLPSIHQAFGDIQTRYGAIKNVMHTAGIVSDATINTVTRESFQRVLNPKVMGAWNLHLVSQEIGLNLDNFVMLSSISVPLGNPGQAAYVGANSFLDTLAAYRQGIGLRGLSLQLGAWESRMIEGLDLSRSAVLAMSHDEGIPLIMKALSTTDPVQVIARLDMKLLGQDPALSGDPMMSEVLETHAKRMPARLSFTKGQAKQKIVEILRGLLELTVDDELDLEESVTSCGMDSIAFAQARGRVLKAIGVEIPMLYLSDSYTMNDMITFTENNVR
ncbi:6-deoxyerythronolide-B synthase EryA1, modules 1 and 2 [Hypsizygus marmoreus]|uniref:6-deoxyerythronolide-B synthase EryA1, modules 1 and 2 n=1 Tax=Hypsizygus marmoreus TaxID=39966 RepID=A0A369KDJ2_HYPMA|nr:6-deoxyerythronolide-B synthase EryA1, modules 1 and 2 [Hypsizygus marmoreus]